METKTAQKTAGHRSVFSENISKNIFRYQQTGSGWGLAAFYQNYRLVFWDNLNVPAPGRSHLLAFLGKKTTADNSLRNNVNLYRIFSPGAKRAWHGAYALAKKHGQTHPSLEQLFLALLKEPSVKNLFKRLNANPHAAQTLLQNYLKLSAGRSGRGIQKIPFEAFAFALEIKNHQLDCLMLFAAVMQSAPHEGILQAIFTNIGLTQSRLKILCVLILNLDFDFPQGSKEAKILFCGRQAAALEQQLGYFYEYGALEQAVKLSAGQTFQDLEHKKALQYLAKAGLLAQAQKTKIISAALVKQAAE